MDQTIFLGDLKIKPKYLPIEIGKKRDTYNTSKLKLMVLIFALKSSILKVGLIIKEPLH